MEDIVTNIKDLKDVKPLTSYRSSFTERSLGSPSLSSLSTVSKSDEWGTGTIITVILIVVILALLGLNIFSYLAKGTDYLGWIVSKFTSQIPDTAKDIVDTTLTGVDLGVDIAAGTVKDASKIISDELHLKNRSKDKSKINNNVTNLLGLNKKTNKENNYKETTEDDEIQQRKKPGYCYIGTDRGYRSCIKINKYDECASKKVFPTMDICINPELRI